MTMIVEVATRLEIGESAVKHRFRKGAALYAKRLSTLLSQSAPNDATDPAT
ncbi:MAG: hypothetical protein KDC95_04005 [Planctomycetes bacterium]|nr:hypothetical protein [Planctomycetota bacterium]